MEKMFGFASQAEAGVSLIWGVGQLESEMTFSPAQAVIDDEMISYCARCRRGVGVDDGTLAVDVAREVGIAGTYLDAIHTAERFRDELWEPGMLWRRRRADWESSGARRLEERAGEAAEELMKAPAADPLDGDRLRELDSVVSGFLKRIGGS